MMRVDATKSNTNPLYNCLLKKEGSSFRINPDFAVGIVMKEKKAIKTSV
jgi:hypothetical protein